VERERNIKRAKEQEKNEGRLGKRTQPPLVFSRSFAPGRLEQATGLIPTNNSGAVFRVY